MAEIEKKVNTDNLAFPLGVDLCKRIQFQKNTALCHVN